MPNIMRFMMVITGPVFAYLPSGLFIYFIASSVWSVVQGVLLRIPFVRRISGIPDREIVTGGPSLKDTAVKIKDWVLEKRTEASRGW